MNPEMLVGHPRGSALIDDYVAGTGPVRTFFRWDWTDPEAYRERARQVSARFDRPARERVAAMLARGQDRPAGPLDRWVTEGGFLVTTGQQPGLFGGPLHTVYKAITAVRLARRLESLLAVPVLPVFWVASEDHDWDEAHDTWVIGVDNELHRIELPEPAHEEREKPLHRITSSFDTAVAELLGQLPETDFTPAVAELLRRCWGPDRGSLPDAFRDTLEALLGPSGLLFVSAHEDTLKEASEGVLLRELHEGGAHEELITRRTADLEEAGYHGQVSILDGAVNLFVEGPDGRDRLYRDGDGFVLHRSESRLSAAEVEARVRDGARTVSPNVLLRPVVETAVLPTLAYVGGPAEVAYFAQIGPLFEAHGVGQPIVVPRRSVTVVESKVRKVLDKFELAPSSLEAPFHELVADIAREELPEAVRKALGGLKGSIASGTAELAEATRAIDPTLKGPVTHARGAAMEALADAERKILQAVKRQNEIALQQLEKARLHLYPDGRPQERVLNVFYYLARYGEEFLEGLLERLDPLPVSEPEG